MDFRSDNKIKIQGGMSSMTDLVFLLLIFFIIISTMITTGYKIDVPKKGNNSNSKKILSVNINDNGYYFFNNKNTPIKKDVLETEIKNNIGLDSVILLYGSNKSHWEYTVKIIDIAKKNNFKITLNGNKK